PPGPAESGRQRDLPHGCVNRVSAASTRRCSSAWTAARGSRATGQLTWHQADHIPPENGRAGRRRRPDNLAGVHAGSQYRTTVSLGVWLPAADSTVTSAAFGELARTEVSAITRAVPSAAGINVPIRMAADGVTSTSHAPSV